MPFFFKIFLKILSYTIDTWWANSAWAYVFWFISKETIYTILLLQSRYFYSYIQGLPLAGSETSFLIFNVPNFVVFFLVLSVMHFERFFQSFNPSKNFLFICAILLCIVYWCLIFMTIFSTGFHIDTLKNKLFLFKHLILCSWI